MSTRHLVDPELLPLLDGLPPVHLSLDELAPFRLAQRESVITAAAPQETPHDVEQQRLTVPGPVDATEVEVVVYSPSDTTTLRPCILHIHGGVRVTGESAGGGLAAALALLARDRKEYTLAFQHLIYPMLDDRTCVATNPNACTGEFVWTRENNHFGWSALLGHEPGVDDVSPCAAPARALRPAPAG